MENITSIAPVKEEQKKEFFIKRAWKKVWGFCKKYSTEIIDVLVTAWIFLIGICYGWILGVINKDNNRDHYEAGKAKGWNQGYVDAVKDIENSGYKVYGGYGDNAGNFVINKVTETTPVAEITAEVVESKEI